MSDGDDTIQTAIRPAAPPSAAPAELLALLAELNGPLYRRYGKRIFDLAAAGAGTAAISPLLAALAGGCG